MPFSSEDATRYKKGLSSSEAKEKWASTANAILADKGSDSLAIRIANSRSRGSSPINRDSVMRRLKRKGFPSG